MKLHNKIQTLNIDNKRLEQLTAMQKAELSEQAIHHQNQTASLKIHLKALSREKEKVDKENEDLADRIACLENAGAVRADQMRNRAAEQESLKEKVRKLEEQLSDKDDQCLALQSDLQRLKLDWHGVESKLVANVERYHLQLVKLKGLNEQLKQKLIDADDIQRGLKGDNTALRKEIDALQKEVRRLTVEMEHVGQSAREENCLVEQLKAENVALQTKLKRIGEQRLKDRQVAFQIQTLRHDALCEKDKEVRRIEGLMKELGQSMARH